VLALTDKKGKELEEYIATLAENLSKCSDKTVTEVLKSLSPANKKSVLKLLKILKKDLNKK
jgi:hypothetical protein